MRLLFFLVFASTVDLFGQGNVVRDPRDGKIYNTILIGRQVWMANDLSTKTVEYECSGFTQSKQDTIHCEELGIWYTWKVAKSACPIGWHLPSKEEYLELLSNIRGNRKYQYKSLIQGEFNAFNNNKRLKGRVFLTSSGNLNAVTFRLSAVMKKVYFAEETKQDSRTLVGAIRCAKDSPSTP